METTENLVLKLNELLEGRRFYRNRFEKLLRDFKDLENPKIKTIDFEPYTWEKLKFYYDKKIAYIGLQNFESAARYRTLEKECQEFLDIRWHYGIEKSMFFFEKEYLFFFCLGTAKIDARVKVYLENHSQ